MADHIFANGKVFRYLLNGGGDKARHKDLCWLVSRMHSSDIQHVPSWSSFNAATSTVNPPLTTVGMLPILQAPSEINDTVRTVINNFKTIAAHLGQKYTNIFADQSLAAGLKNSHGSTQMTLKMLLCSWVICTYCLTFNILPKPVI